MNDAGYRISNITAISMIGLAVGFDAIKFLLDLTGVGDFITWMIPVVAFPIYWIWFLTKGVNYNGSKGGQNLFITIASTVVDLIPFINMIPATTLGILGFIINSRIEDMKKHEEEVKQEKLVAMARLARMRWMQQQRAMQARAAQLSSS